MKSEYNTSERIIARNIHDMKGTQKKLFNTWHDLDIKINLLKHDLQGKYQGKVMVPNLLTK